ncbi:rhomboid family intramembrane serine protease [Lipingzhangella sp. LS1_29]|uniref:Rhomboid family intramembrane serine protease n=1 Tax=Lipingzhangella rawalii TaxID=2055835 RepID=A0ABU2H1G1_9ACTN|nr:rhomboid family intramembrane serine protease [Lipingzhangella rawalii]MDS1268695.1 rhomboid family intramembrane serine protease [Lipingzhangella rawalii]
MASIPLSDDYPPRRLPVLTYGLIAVNVTVFLLSPLSTVAFWYGGLGPERACAQETVLVSWGLVPAQLLGNAEVSGWTGCPGSVPGPTPVASVVTHMFLHATPAHLVGNMVFLFVFGPCVEDRLGRLRFVAFYLSCGVVGALAHALSAPTDAVPLVGASGAISGVLGAYLVVQHRSRVLTLILWLIPVRLPGWVVVATYFVLQYLFYLSPADTDGPQIAYDVHVYGFLAGVIGGLLTSRRHWRLGVGTPPS